jgi:hypothetical protein
MALIAWLIPLAFVLVAALPSPALPGGDLVGLASIACAAASALFLFSIRGRLWQTLWSRVMLAVFVFGYFIKSALYVFTYNGPWRELWIELDWVTLADVVRAYLVTATAFVAFCVVASVLAFVRPGERFPTRLAAIPTELDGRRLRAILWGTVLLSIVATILPLLLGFGVMGAEATTLPFRLDAVVTRFRINVGPALLLWVLWVSDRKQTSRLWLLALASLLGVGLLDGFMRSSRGSILAVVFPAVLLWLLTKRLTRARLSFGAAAFCLFIVLYPVLTYQRAFRNMGLSISDGVQFAMRASPQAGDLIAPVAFKIGTRISGADGLWHVLAFMKRTAQQDAGVEGPNRVKRAMSSDAMARYSTEQVWGVTAVGEGRPPGLLGALAIVGGGLGPVVPLLALFLVTLWAAWWIAASLKVAPVALALFASMLLAYASEGGLGLQDPIGYALSIAAVSCVHAWTRHAGMLFAWHRNDFALPNP